MKCPCKAAVTLWQETKPNEAFVACGDHGIISWDGERQMAYQGGQPMWPEGQSGARFGPDHPAAWPSGDEYPRISCESAYHAFFDEFFPEWRNG